MTHDHQTLGSKLRTAALYLFGIAMLGLLAITLVGQKAKAADLGGTTSRAEAEALSPATHWTGCGVGIMFGYTDGLAIPTGSVGGVGSNGEPITPSLSCDMRMGSSPLVLGAEVSYGWMLGNLDKLPTGPHTTGGVQDDISVLGKFGILVNPNTKLYAVAGYSMLGLQGMGVSSVNGYKVGLGTEVKLTGPVSLDLRYSYADYDISKLTGPVSMDAHTSTFGVGIIYKFYSGAN
jgi:opacity protein-like surface antigen